MHEGVGKDFLEKLAFERELRGLREFEQRLIFGDSKGRGYMPRAWKQEGGGNLKI